jgi:peroxiredoxin Q/BCP
MAQLRRDIGKFDALNCKLVVIGPEGAERFQDYWRKESLSFLGLPDPGHTVLKKYGQEVNIFKLGRMPAQVLIDKNRVARFVYYGHSMKDIPSNEDVLQILRDLDDDS